jgi:hypothetical protein
LTVCSTCAAYDAIADLAKPTIAIVQGVRFGGGCALALCCDLRDADDGATFCIPPARLGLAYSLAETRRLVELVGPAQAKEMLMGACVIGAEEALRIGLLTRVFRATDLERETMAFADVLCGLSQFSIHATKAVIRDILNGAVAETATSRRCSRSSSKALTMSRGATRSSRNARRTSPEPDLEAGLGAAPKPRPASCGSTDLGWCVWLPRNGARRPLPAFRAAEHGCGGSSHPPRSASPRGPSAYLLFGCGGSAAW